MCYIIKGHPEENVTRTKEEINNISVNNKNLRTGVSHSVYMHQYELY